jgi:dephospho-CoA kinase
MLFSIIIPVYNRPEEISELLLSIANCDLPENLEIVIVEDGSNETCKDIVSQFENLNISYFFKQNSGPGDSRNFGMQRAKGNYFLIFDSDCLLPKEYFTEVQKELNTNFVSCFGGPDSALKSFSTIQKAINFTMTSFLTTGGIRGGSESLSKFQPRSFNMGISKEAFLASGGFSAIHPGEDPDLSIRLWKLGFTTRLFPKAFVYHKRRIDWQKFSVQVSKFGKARPILNLWHPEYAKITFWFPSLFVIGFFFSVFALLFLIDLPIKLYFGYFLLIFISALIQTKNLKIAAFTIIATYKQFFGYGLGFLESFFKINILKIKPEVAFPYLFFEKVTPPEKQITIQFKKTKIIGLTGGIGSGKTTVAKYFEQQGIPIYISDLEAKNLMDNPEVIKEIALKFGNSIISDQGLNREVLSSIVFQDKEKLQELNQIVHPKVKEHFLKWLQENSTQLYVIKESAILFESKSYLDCDYIISVIAPIDIRIERILKRDNTSKEKILLRIENQWTDAQRVEKSDFTIENINWDKTVIKINEILKSLKIK